MNKKTLRLNWNGYFVYTDNNVHRYAPTKAGVYKIAVKQKAGKLRVRYVGQASNIDRRLNEHLDMENESNECLADRIKKYLTKFSFAEIGDQDDRNGAELALYKHYQPSCNDPDAIPNGPDIEINYQ